MYEISGCSSSTCKSAAHRNRVRETVLRGNEEKQPCRSPINKQAEIRSKRKNSRQLESSSGSESPSMSPRKKVKPEIPVVPMKMHDLKQKPVFTSESLKSAWRSATGPRLKARPAEAGIRKNQVITAGIDGTSHSKESRGGTETSTSESEGSDSESSSSSSRSDSGSSFSGSSSTSDSDSDSRSTLSSSSAAKGQQVQLPGMQKTKTSHCSSSTSSRSHRRSTHAFVSQNYEAGSLKLKIAALKIPVRQESQAAKTGRGLCSPGESFEKKRSPANSSKSIGPPVSSVTSPADSKSTNNSLPKTPSARQDSKANPSSSSRSELRRSTRSRTKPPATHESERKKEVPQTPVSPQEQANKDGRGNINSARTFAATSTSATFQPPSAQKKSLRPPIRMPKPRVELTRLTPNLNEVQQAQVNGENLNGPKTSNHMPFSFASSNPSVAGSVLTLANNSDLTIIPILNPSTAIQQQQSSSSLTIKPHTSGRNDLTINPSSVSLSTIPTFLLRSSRWLSAQRRSVDGKLTDGYDFWEGTERNTSVQNAIQTMELDDKFQRNNSQPLQCHHSSPSPIKKPSHYKSRLLEKFNEALRKPKGQLPPPLAPTALTPSTVSGFNFKPTFSPFKTKVGKKYIPDEEQTLVIPRVGKGVSKMENKKKKESKKSKIKEKLKAEQAQVLEELCDFVRLRLVLSRSPNKGKKTGIMSEKKHDQKNNSDLPLGFTFKQITYQVKPNPLMPFDQIPPPSRVGESSVAPSLSPSSKNWKQFPGKDQDVQYSGSDFRDKFVTSMRRLAPKFGTPEPLARRELPTSKYDKSLFADQAKSFKSFHDVLQESEAGPAKHSATKESKRRSGRSKKSTSSASDASPPATSAVPPITDQQVPLPKISKFKKEPANVLVIREVIRAPPVIRSKRKNSRRLESSSGSESPSRKKVKSETPLDPMEALEILDVDLNATEEKEESSLLDDNEMLTVTNAVPSSIPDNVDISATSERVATAHTSSSGCSSGGVKQRPRPNKTGFPLAKKRIKTVPVFRHGLLTPQSSKVEESVNESALIADDTAAEIKEGESFAVVRPDKVKVTDMESTVASSSAETTDIGGAMLKVMEQEKVDEAAKSEAVVQEVVLTQIPLDKVERFQESVERIEGEQEQDQETIEDLRRSRDDCEPKIISDAEILEWLEELQETKTAEMTTERMVSELQAENARLKAECDRQQNLLANNVQNPPSQNEATLELAVQRLTHENLELREKTDKLQEQVRLLKRLIAISD